jgi:ABC-type branched-subunit amino acid transport system substrate-binding protein
MTPDSVKDLEDAINNAEDVINNPDSTPEEIADAIKAIEDAINNLTPDKTELEKAITAGNEVLGGDTEKFTPESVQALEDAIAQGEAVDADPNATVEKIKAATEAIKDALKTVSFDGVTGAVSFNEEGDANKDMAFIKTIQDGAFKFLTTTTING